MQAGRFTEDIRPGAALLTITVMLLRGEPHEAMRPITAELVPARPQIVLHPIITIRGSRHRAIQQAGLPGATLHPVVLRFGTTQAQVPEELLPGAIPHPVRLAAPAAVAFLAADSAAAVTAVVADTEDDNPIRSSFYSIYFL